MKYSRIAAALLATAVPFTPSQAMADDLAERSKIPKDKPVLLYCNTGTLSAQAGFALRVAGYENVRILQGGYAEWKAEGGFDAATKATSAVKH